MINQLTLLFVFIAIIWITNVINSLMISTSIGKSYQYGSLNSDFKFWAVPTKGSGLVMMERSTQFFLERHPELEKVIIGRTFKRNFLKFWMWGEYLFRAEWQYPYCGK